jgi:hypothetical protein
MMIFGVSRFEINCTYYGPKAIFEPLMLSMDLGRERPECLQRIYKDTFYHWSQILANFGIAKINMKPARVDQEKILDLWQKTEQENTDGQSSTDTGS